ncbi:MAG: pantoate--beta-alanine ligase [Candidatus Hydrogenedentota bacterium]|nr:MAG: pantoate--beta-alanine ligase [Candidatus Hydrogenedentota bacterium]
MNIIHHPDEMRQWAFDRRAEGKTIGLVPTMGALHEGHLSLMQASVEENDLTVASIFVNPAQFAPHEDYDQYPRTLKDDCAKSEAMGVDLIYAPNASAMYPRNYASYVEVERLQDGLCGVTRPHFFRGVATVVAKLFNTTVPHKAYFGLKDGQQVGIIKRMVRDLDFGIEIVALPTIRESDGLAMSSRNKYLSDSDRKRALCISRSLNTAQELMAAGEVDAARVIAKVREVMHSLEIDYIELVDAEELTPVDSIKGPVMLAVAAKVGDTRLIDNMRFDPTDDFHAAPKQYDINTSIDSEAGGA